MAKVILKVDTEKVKVISSNHQARRLAKAVLITMDWRRIVGVHGVMRAMIGTTILLAKITGTTISATLLCY